MVLVKDYPTKIQYDKNFSYLLMVRLPLFLVLSQFNMVKEFTTANLERFDGCWKITEYFLEIMKYTKTQFMILFGFG